MRWLALLILTATALRAEGDRPGDFDYWVLALSWSPTWCALEGDARGAPECAAGAARGWALHGLWPQHEIGWPSWCGTDRPGPTRAEARAMLDIAGSEGLVRHQWRKHGSCSGLPAADYLALSRRAYRAVTRPDLLRRLDAPVRLPATVIEEAFLSVNPGLTPDMLTVTCKGGRIHEVRLCLARDTLAPVPCGRDVVRDCTARDALLAPIR